jgi:hypothetical protein
MVDGIFFSRVIGTVVVIVVADGYGGRRCRYAGFHDRFP